MSVAQDQYVKLAFDHTSAYNLPQSGNRSIWDEISHINFLIGATSAGKSRFLRHVFSSSPYNFLSRSSSPEDFSKIFLELRRGMNTNISQQIVGWGPMTREKLDRWCTQPEVFDVEGENSFDKILASLEAVASQKDHLSFQSIGYSSGLPDYEHRRVKALHATAAAALEKLRPSVGKEPRVYIPVLRGLRPLSGDSVYKDRTQKDYFGKLSAAGQCEIFTGEGIYEDLKKRLLGSSKSRAEVSEFEGFLSEHFFDRKKSKLSLK